MKIRIPLALSITAVSPLLAHAAGLNAMGINDIKALGVPVPPIEGHAAPSRIEPLIETIRKGDSLAAQAKALEDLGKIAYLTADEELEIVNGLVSIGDCGAISDAVRSSVIMTVGTITQHFKYPASRRRAATYLIEVARLEDPADNRVNLRRYALLGLSRAVTEFSESDSQTAESTLNAVFDLLDRRDDPEERLAVLLVLRNCIHQQGLRFMEKNPALRARLEEKFLRPLLSDLSGFYSDPRKNSVEYREATMETLFYLSNGSSSDETLRRQCPGILGNMETLEPDARLRLRARFFAHGVL